MSAFAPAICQTPLHNWIADKFGIRSVALSRERIIAEQLRLLNETVSWARQRSAFYRERLAHRSPAPLESIEGIRDLPFTTAADLAREAGRLVCVSQDEIRRVVTLETSGTSGSPKRVFFTDADLELALDFFENGVSAVAARGERMVIALPADREGSVGRLLASGIARAGVIPVPCGLFTDPARVLGLLEDHRPAAIIGLPIQMLSLACAAEATNGSAFRDLRSIVLCSDHVASSLVRTLRRRTGASIFEHYGMTEMGLGGGIDCEAHAGYHLRECDFLFEIVEPSSGTPLPDGMEGEIVFTTLTRHGMPLIRYRTGDLSRFLPTPCPCGTVLRRLERVCNRIDSAISLGSAGAVTQAALDEALFAVAGIADFAATMTPGTPPQLDVVAFCPSTTDFGGEGSLLGALDGISSIAIARRSDDLRVNIRVTPDPLSAPGAKRRIGRNA